MLTEEAYRLK